VPPIKKQPQFDVLYIGIKKSLPGLKKAIDTRVDKMIKAGLEREVKKLIKKYGKTTVLKNTIGYKEWLQNPQQASHAGGQVKLHTLQFAKRQLTWFKKYPGVKTHWINPHTKTGFNKILKICKEFLQNK